WLHHEDDGDMLEAGVHVVDVRPGKRNLYIGIGAKLHAINTDWFDAGGVGVGGFFRYAFPANRDVSVAGYGYYAPSVLSLDRKSEEHTSELQSREKLVCRLLLRK